MMTRLTALVALVGTVELANGECANACSGHGDCGAFDQCSCYRNWQGNDCSERTCPFGHAHVDSPKGDLNMGGGELTGPGDVIAINSEVYPLGTTEQYPDAQANEAHFYMECSNKGLCDRKSGECDCFDGYDGTSCERASCPGGHGGDSEQCSGHGTCHSISYLATHHSEANLPLSFDDAVTYNLWDAGYTRGCVCDPPFTGPDCAERACKANVDPLYTSTGTALRQKAVAINSCTFGRDDAGDFNNQVASPSYITTNGGRGYPVGTTTVAAAAALHTSNVAGTENDSREFTVVVSLADTSALSFSGRGNRDSTAVVDDSAGVFAWAKDGAEVILQNSADKTTIGCRYVVLAVEIDGTDRNLYLQAKGESSDLDRCGASGAGTADASLSYNLFYVENTFSLLFTDHTGEVYRTAPISAAQADYSAEVKAALEGLPNGVVSQVTVTANTFDGWDATGGSSGDVGDNLRTVAAPATATDGAFVEMAYEIDFVSNPGKLGALEIDSTPIRLGQQLQAGIECYFDQATNAHVENVYSSVGYSEIGEDETYFTEEVGIVGYFVNADYASADTSTAGYDDAVVSGQENLYLYPRESLVAAGVAAGDVLKIEEKLYVVNSVQNDYVELNTRYTGKDVTGTTGAQVLENDDDGAAAGGDFSVSLSAETFTLTAAVFNTPEVTSDGGEIFTEREMFADGAQFRMTHSDTYTFDCVFTVASTTHTSVSDAASAGDFSGTEYTIEIEVQHVANCPSFAAANTLAGADIEVNLFHWAPEDHTNGMYTTPTRIFKSGMNAVSTGNMKYVYGANQVLAAMDQGISISVGDQVIYGNEVNIITAIDTNLVTMKNAVVFGTSEDLGVVDDAGAGQTAYAQVSIAGYDIQNMYLMNTDDGVETTTPYTYVSECSNRGLCEGSSGLCKCFKGYTGDSCETISELYG
jgi:hypothetical protein